MCRRIRLEAAAAEPSTLNLLLKTTTMVSKVRLVQQREGESMTKSTNSMMRSGRDSSWMSERNARVSLPCSSFLGVNEAETLSKAATKATSKGKGEVCTDPVGLGWPSQPILASAMHSRDPPFSAIPQGQK